MGQAPVSALTTVDSFQLRSLRPSDVLIHYQSPKRKRAIHRVLTEQSGVLPECTGVDVSATIITSAPSVTSSAKEEVATKDGGSTHHQGGFFYCLRNTTLLSCSEVSGECAEEPDLA